MRARVAVLVGAAAWSAPAPVTPPLRVGFTLAGQTLCTGHAPGPAEGLVTLDCIPEGGKPALHVAFFGGAAKPNGYLRLRQITAEGLPSPLLQATAVSTGGSDSEFESALISEVQGTLQDLWPSHWKTNILDDFCVGTLGPKTRVGVAAFSYVWGDDRGEVHYSEHRYQLTFYGWDGRRFVPGETRSSPRRVATWLDAARDLGLSCPGQLHTFSELDSFR